MISRYEIISSSVSSIYHDIQKIQRTEMAKYGLKGPHAQCLLAMSRHPEGIAAARLCEICEKDKAAISRTLAELEQAGMVHRQMHNGSKYRASLTLTQRGQAAAETVRKTAQRAVERAGQGFDDAQREVFYRVLGLIADHLHQICTDGLGPDPQTEK